MSFGRFHKFKAEKVQFHGRSFGSKLEAAVYGLLLIRERAGEITDIKCQVHVKFHTHDHGKIHMIPDFTFISRRGDELIYCEAKGFKTRDWLRKRKAWMAGGPGRMEIWEGNYRAPKLREVLVPATITKEGGSELGR